MMTRLRATTIATLVLAGHSLLVPSCVQWNIGTSIRECAETCVGICPAEVYLVGEAKPTADGFPFSPREERDFALTRDGRIRVAREAEYEADTPLVRLTDLWFGQHTRAQRITLTDAYRKVDFSESSKFAGLKSSVGECFAPAGQPMQREEPVYTVTLDARTMGCAEVRRSKWYPLAVVVAAPFDYLIDPVLSVASTPVVALGLAGAAACSQVTYWLRDDTPTAPAEPAPPATPES